MTLLAASPAAWLIVYIAGAVLVAAWIVYLGTKKMWWMFSSTLILVAAAGVGLVVYQVSLSMQKCPEVGLDRVPTQKEIDAAPSRAEAIERWKEGYTEEDAKSYDESVHTVTDKGDETGSKPATTHKKPSTQQPGMQPAPQTPAPTTETPPAEKPAPAPEVAKAPAPADNTTAPKKAAATTGSTRIVVGKRPPNGGYWREAFESARYNAILTAKKAGYIAAVAAVVLGYIILGIMFMVKSGASKRRMQEFMDAQEQTSRQETEKKLGETDLTFEPPLHTHVTPDDRPPEMAEEEETPRDIAEIEEEEDLDSEDDD